MSILDRRSRLMFRVTIPSDGRTFAFDDNGTAKTVQITAGDYYCYYGLKGLGTSGISGYPNLYGTIAQEIAIESTAQSYTFEAAAPTGSSADGKDRGVAFSADGGLGFGIDWDATTLDPRLFGWPANSSGTITTTAPALYSPHEPLGVWTPYRCLQKAERDVLRHLKPSSDEVTGANFHQSDYGETTTRLLVWKHQPAAAVIKGKAYEDGYDAAQILEDFGVYERLWEAMARREEILIAYSMDPLELTVDIFEVGVLKNHDEAAAFRKTLRLMRSGGEFYQVAFLFEVKSGTRND